MKVRQHRLPERRVGIAEVIVANAVVDRESVCDLPFVFSESTARGFGKAVIIGKGLSCNWIESDVGFSKWIVVDQVDDACVGKDWLAVSACEVRQVIPMPAFVTDSKVVIASDIGHHIPPMKAMLNIVFIRIGITKTDTQVRDVDHWNSEQSLIGV